MGAQLYIGTQDVDPRSQTPFTHIAGVSYVGNPIRLAFDEAEPDLLQFAGFGPFIYAGDVSAEGVSLFKGDARAMVIAATAERLVFTTPDAEVGGKRIDVDRSGTLLAGELPLESIDSIGVIVKKSMTGKEKALRLTIESPLFNAGIDPAIEIDRDGRPGKLKDPWPVARRLVDVILTRHGLNDADRAQLQQTGWSQGDSGSYEFDLEAFRAQPPNDGQASPPPEPALTPVIATPEPDHVEVLETVEIPPAAPSDDVSTTLDEPVTPVMTVYVVSDAHSLVRSDVQAGLNHLWSSVASDHDAEATVQIGLAKYGDSVSQASVLSPPSAGVPDLSPPAGTPNYDDLARYLRALIDHDLGWYKESGTPVFRPLLILLSAAALPASSSGLLSDVGWRFRPNLVFVRTASGHASESSVKAAFSVCPERDDENIQPVFEVVSEAIVEASRSLRACLLYTSPSPRDRQKSRMPSSA